MEFIVRHPVPGLAALGIVSGLLGTYLPGPGFGEAPNFGIFMVMTGVWFGFVVAFGGWIWGQRSWRTAASALLGTWIGWELAVNLAVQLDDHWLAVAAIPEGRHMSISGLAAGAVGALLTWAGLAITVPRLRGVMLPVAVMGVGALLGLLLPFKHNYDNGAVLLLPWQAGVAAALGAGLSRRQVLWHAPVQKPA